MTLVKFAPSKEMANINNRLKKFFEDFDSPFFTDWGKNFNFNTNVFTPRVDVTEDNDNLYVHAEIPGVDKKDVKVSVVGDILTISGEKKSEQRDENKNYYRIERTGGSFSRSFTLPAEIQVDKISAESKDGVLVISLPKSEEAKVVEKQIEIK
ncbi:MAG: Hsp20/alpha crystallin family protein [Ignavibacteriae bacterium]|nr:MAG: Hsp20/alpha crystallin family protein [Ignavibacteriota bacterium]